MPVAVAPAKPEQKTYAQVVKSSVLIGGSSVLEIGFRIIRTKAMAVLVGPVGIGLLGLYGTITSLVGNLAGMGLKTSGVRQIAEAVGTADAQQIARTVKTLRRVAFVTGALGALLLLAGSQLVARITFGANQHVGAVALLALAVFFSDLAEAQATVVQGMRRIADLARISIIGAVFGTVFSIPIVYIWREAGLAPSLVCVAAMSILTSWWYARKVKLEPVRMSWRQVAAESADLLRMGVAFMASGLMWMGSAYVVRLLIVRRLGVEAAGYYQAAWALGGLYTGLIFRAMSADFYPRLTAVAHDNAECNRLTNEQAEIVLLLACPGVLGTLTCAPLIINLFYSNKFGAAIDILRWICLGMLLQVASWSMGFIVMAKGKPKTFFWSELLSNVALLGLVWLGMMAFGLTGTGMGFCGMYLLYGIGIYLVVRRLSGFRWSSANRRLLLVFAPQLIGVFAGWYVLPRAWFFTLGSLLTVLCGFYSLKILCSLLPFERFPAIVQKALRRCGLQPRTAPCPET